MKEIDWSKAPEWANVVIAADNDTLYWTEQWGGVCKRQKVGDDSMCGVSANMKYPHNWTLVEERPKQAWSGEGLPPVGTVCEWFSYEYGWLGGKVAGHDNDVTIVRHNDGYEGCHSHRIRPIKTQEQLAAEEREKAIREMYRKTLVHTSDYEAEIQRKVCESLYDAGYRLTK